jgi:pyruvate dehydrogenase E2 component (dihydrolipoamide acetyltransferase)
MPKLGLTMTEGLVAEWRIAEGDRFSADDVLVVIETDKVAHDIQAPADGHLLKVFVPAGDTVPVSTELGQWSIDGYADTSSGVARAESSKFPQATDAMACQDQFKTAEPVGPEHRDRADGFVKATPFARRIARQDDISLHDVTGTGPGARIVADDVRMFISARGGARAVGAPGVATPPHPEGADRIAARPVLPAQHDIPQVGLAMDVEIGALLSLRQRLNNLCGPDVKLTHLLIAAVVRALRASPQMNRIWQDQGIVAFDRIDVGVAVRTPDGLLSPVIGDLAGSSFFDLVHKVDVTIELARSGRAAPDKVHGAAMTIANAGKRGVRYLTPVIQPGQSGFLALGTIQECFRPDADGKPRLQHELGLALFVDRRVHTEGGVLHFMEKLRGIISQPLTILADY